jgi:hypothetical protein
MVLFAEKFPESITDATQEVQRIRILTAGE